MNKYKDRYVFRYERDLDGNIHNRFDNYIVCNKGSKVYRFNDDILVFESPKKIRLIQKDEEGNITKDYRPLVLEVRDTECEREIFFKEENIEKLEELFKIRRKRILSEEALEQARIKMKNIIARRKVVTE